MQVRKMPWHAELHCDQGIELCRQPGVPPLIELSSVILQRCAPLLLTGEWRIQPVQSEGEQQAIHAIA
ncbi:hypothetical protein D3C80_2026760 [compost metagenome]